VSHCQRIEKEQQLSSELLSSQKNQGIFGRGKLYRVKLGTRLTTIGKRSIFAMGFDDPKLATLSM